MKVGMGREEGREETFKILKGRGWWYCDGTREVVDVKLGERLESLWKIRSPRESNNFTYGSVNMEMQIVLILPYPPSISNLSASLHELAFQSTRQPIPESKLHNK